MWEEFFDVLSMTTRINNVGFVPHQLGSLGLFDEDGIATTILMVTEHNGTLTLIEPTARGGDGQSVMDGDDNAIPFMVDHFEINDKLLADALQNVAVLGGEAGDVESVEAAIDKKIKVHTRSFDATLEHQRVGAIKGNVTSAKGRVLHNLYDRFGIALPAPIVLGLGSDQPKIASKIKGDIVHSIEDDLDDAYDHMHCMAGRELHAALWDQESVRATYLADNQGYRIRDGVPDVFTAGGVTFERYRTGKKAKAKNQNKPFIAENEGHVFPVGVPDLFMTRFAPADLEETVNTIGLPRYSRQYPMHNGKGRHLDSQTNAISLCTQPSVLRKITT